MKRLSRDQKQAETRGRLLAAAQKLFLEEGYLAVSIDRVAEAAGFSKGAFYSNFACKEDILLEILNRHGRASLAGLLAAIEAGEEAGTVIDAIADWATAAAREGSWSLLVLDYARYAAPGRPDTVFRVHWRTLGEKLVEKLDLIFADPETLGALVFELTYAPALGLPGAPAAGDLIRLALGGLKPLH